MDVMQKEHKHEKENESWAAFGEALTSARENLGMTKAQLSKVLGIKWGTLHKIEVGGLQPGQDLILKIRDTTGLDATCPRCGRFWFPAR